MKTYHRTVSDICASAGPFIGIRMNAPECFATFPNSAQVTDLIKLIFGGGVGVEVLLLPDFPLCSPFAHSRSPSSYTSHDPPTPFFFNQPPRHSVLKASHLLKQPAGVHFASPHFRTSRDPPER